VFLCVFLASGTTTSGMRPGSRSPSRTRRSCGSPTC